MCSSNAPKGETCLVTMRVGSAHLPICLRCMMITFNASVDILPLYIGVRLRMLLLLPFHKVFHPLQFLFSCASTNRCFKVIIGASSKSFKISMSFYKLRLHCLY